MRLIGSLVLLFLLTACNDITQSGHLRAMVFPNHNEDLMTAGIGVKKYEIDGSQTLRYRNLSITLNPILVLGNLWPAGNSTYDYTIGVVEVVFWARYHMTDSLTIAYKKQKYILAINQTSVPDLNVCNCTYGNSVGLEYRW